MRICCLLLLHVFTCMLAVEQPAQQRVFYEQVSGSSFRVPYHVYIPQHKGSDVYKVHNIVEGRYVLTDSMRIRHFTAKNDGEDLRAILQKEVGDANLKIAVHDYFESARSHRDKEWLDVPVQAYRLSAKNTEALICKCGDRIAGLVISGTFDVKVAAGVIQSFEMMKDVNGRWSTWRAFQSSKNMVFNFDHKLLPTKTVKRAEQWDQAMEMESQHFHLTFICAPKLVPAYLEMLESLYVSLREWFPIDKDPHFKYEIHITKTPKQFGQLAKKLLDSNIYEDLANKGAAFGGFFSSQACATFTYTDKIKHSQMNAKLQLAHEFVHQYLFVNSNNNYTLPKWFNEALAVMFETGRYTKSVRSMLPPQGRFKALRLYYKKNDPVRSVRDYVEKDEGFTNVHEYAEAYAILHFLLNEKGGSERLKGYWVRLQQNQQGLDLFKEVFLKDRLAQAEDVDAYYVRWQKDLFKYIKGKKADKKITIK